LPAASPAQPTKEKSSKLPEMELVREGGDLALVPKTALTPLERQLFLPALTLLGIHLASCIPLYLLTHLSKSVSYPFIRDRWFTLTNENRNSPFPQPSIPSQH
jgi:hypothetical protein